LPSRSSNIAPAAVLPLFLTTLIAACCAPLAAVAQDAAVRHDAAIRQDAAVLVEEFRFGSFVSAAHLSIDPFGCVYVADAGSHTVQKFDSTGARLLSIGGQGWDLAQFDHPMGIDASLGIAVYVADMGNHRVVRCDRDLNALGVFAPRDDAAGIAFGMPRDVALSRRGPLLIVDGENARIVSTSGFATVDDAFGGVESGAGKLRMPLALAVGDDDEVYVLEPDRVVVFDTYGSYRRQFGEGAIAGARGICAHGGRVVVATAGALLVFDADGALRQQFAPGRFIFSAAPGEFRDILWTETRVLLLTATDVIMLAPRIAQ
jgi:DNA-binding beta-propeller fold protein YncE